MHSFARVDDLQTSEHANVLRSDGMQHMSEELNIGLLKWELLNTHNIFKAVQLAALKKTRYLGIFAKNGSTCKS